MDELRQALVDEQKGLCCYCMARIEPGRNTMKVEHWQCQAHHDAEQLNYRNLLGACLGGHGQAGEKQHCDTKKGDLGLRWNPANPAHRIESRIRYELDGSIRSDDSIFNEQLDSVLNLNLAFIRNNRKGILTALLQWWHAEKPVDRERIEREIVKRIETPGNLDPYSPVAVWWLRQKLKARKK